MTLGFRFLALALVILTARAPAAQAVEILSANNSLKPVLRLITRAQHSLKVEMYLLGDQRVIGALKDAAARGVNIRLLLEASTHRNRSLVKKLKYKRIELRWYKAPVNSKRAKLYARAACADARRLLVGSANWTRQGLSRDRQSLVVVNDVNASKVWEKQFEKAWVRGLKALPRRWRLLDELRALPDPQVYMEGDPRLNKRRGK